MSHIVEKSGQSLAAMRDEKRSELSHVSIHAGPDASKKHPSWIVVHHGEEGPIEEHSFDAGEEMMKHVGRVTCAEPEEE